ncbi:oligosaccharide flippase family protein [Paraglaciecola polaris]|uniref:Polysaccharide biosynthesis protein n=1 Tax=Paraglaciecola polaris LMG 21857 TaxID=1129793 RepID=K6ZBF2_9ALTE|nr:oligosaccharide flippase family protein [Paraglaciecola polaris]GAC33431.1 hypothetical protein GPLA_2533 [Paraglaciecola polaris LMG 21857]
MVIFKDSMLYLIGELLAKAMPFLLLPYLTRTLGPSGFGDLTLYQVIIALLFIAVGLNQDGAISRYYYVYGKRAIGLINFSGILYSSVIFLFSCFISYIFSSEILFACSFCAYTQSLIANQLTFRQMQRKVKEYLAIQFFNSFLSVIFTVLLFEFFNPSAIGRIYIVILSQVLTIAFSVMLVPGGALDSFRKVKINLRSIKISFFYLFSFGAPLIIHNLSLFSKGQLDRVFVYDTYSDGELGIYAAGFQVASILAILLMAANKATIPYYYEGLKAGSINFLNVSRWVKLSLFLVPIPALIAFIVPESLYLIFLGDEFAESKIYTCIFLLGIGMTMPYYISVNYLFFHGKTGVVSLSTVTSAALHISLLFTIGQKQMIYMASALFLTNLLTFTLVYFYCWKFFLKTKLNQR